MSSEDDLINDWWYDRSLFEKQEIVCNWHINNMETKAAEHLKVWYCSRL